MKKTVLFLIFIGVGVAAQSLLALGPPPPSAPDGGTTAALLTAGVGGVMYARKYFRR